MLESPSRTLEPDMDERGTPRLSEKTKMCCVGVCVCVRVCVFELSWVVPLLLEAPGPEMCTFGVLGLSCETPAAPKPPGLRTTTRAQTCTFEGPSTKIPREDPEREEKNEFCGEGGKKERNFRRSRGGRSQEGRSREGRSREGRVPGRAVPGRAVPGRAVPGRAVPGRAVPGRAVPGRAVPGRAVPGTAVPGTAVRGHRT